jgi:hypothetical protein
VFHSYAVWFSQYNLPEIGKKLAYKANREGVEEHFPEPSVRKTIAVDVSLIDHYDKLLGEVELYQDLRSVWLAGHDPRGTQLGLQVRAKQTGAPGIQSLAEFFSLDL